jgi:hypothetical protein
VAAEHHNNGAFEEKPNFRLAILAPRGTALGATIMIPSDLLPIEWDKDDGDPDLPRGQLLPAFATKAVLAGEEKVEKHPCYKVVCERKVGTWTFWVDKKSSLLRKCEERVSPKHGLGLGLWGRSTSRLQTETYTIDSINKKLDDKLFADPMKKN